MASGFDEVARRTLGVLGDVACISHIRRFL
jgi:hypothetical protein